MGLSYSLEFILEGIGESAETAGNFSGSIEGFASLSEAKEGISLFIMISIRKI